MGRSATGRSCTKNRFIIASTIMAARACKRYCKAWKYGGIELVTSKKTHAETDGGAETDATDAVF